MSEYYIGRAAEAAARAKHNRIHKVKKTAKKRPAKKAPAKAAKAIEEALGAFKPAPANEPSPSTEELVNDADEWTEYGPLGGQDEDAIAREVLGLELPDAPLMTQEEPSTPSVEAVPHTVPQSTQDAPQAASWVKRSPVATCILSLIDALNFLHREGHLRKLPEKDVLILKNRIKTARKLIEKL